MFKPLREAHAISEMVAFIETVRPFDTEVLTKLSKLQRTLRKELPKFETVQTVTATVDMQNNALSRAEMLSPKLGGIVLQRIGPDGEAQWVLRIMENVIAVHCLDYTRWADVWKKTRKYLVEVFALLDISQNPVSGIGIKYVDKFIHELGDGDYDASQLIKKESALITPVIFDKGPLWHSHCGWYESSGPESKARFLNQCNVSTIYEKTDHVTTVEHNALMRYLSPVLNPLRAGKNDATLLDEVMEELHEANKRLLRGLLTDSMCKRIRLLDASEEV